MQFFFGALPWRSMAVSGSGLAVFDAFADPARRHAAGVAALVG
ncbi:hypothetical protein [Xanthomonas floridensis]|uniref:Uncharacterized protein n=1 Tax=Xanthomonas floridensis TaxID=1843580 RepID=A0ABU5PZ41_9XANT|nr:hypothetical protein [Xanthomonas floridensis]MEA5124509.1 hypothetical protein [Xanthomonas floridensis]MEA5130283.1 hypothetical protein [Xanthomonas floridensis]